MVAGRGIVRNYGRNNNSPATGSRTCLTPIPLSPTSRMRGRECACENAAPCFGCHNSPYLTFAFATNPEFRKRSLQKPDCLFDISHGEVSMFKSNSHCTPPVRLLYTVVV